ncbi:hypothetical protein AB1N83_013915 [Pleurotus pulmonarius]
MKCTVLDASRRLYTRTPGTLYRYRKSDCNQSQHASPSPPLLITPSRSTIVADADRRRRVRLGAFRLRASSQREDGKTVGGEDGWRGEVEVDEHRHLPPAVAKCASLLCASRFGQRKTAKRMPADA